MPTTSIILSGAFADPEISAEFGLLPPAFLPLGGRRLVSFQAHELAAIEGPKVITLPDSFQLSESDAALLDEVGLEVLRAPEGLTLGNSLVHALLMLGVGSRPVRLLHGDTLLPGIDLVATDVVSIARTTSPYIWGAVRCEDERVVAISREHGPGDDEREVLSGYFHIGNAATFAGEIARAGGDFVRGLDSYARSIPVYAVRSWPWFDFGHVNTFYESRRHITTQRAFNRLAIDERTVTKSGEPTHKIEAEAAWFESLPSDLRLFTPHYLGRSKDPDRPGYKLEYVYRPALADLYVFGRLPEPSWTGIFQACDEVLTAFARHRPAEAQAGEDLYLGKTLQRLDRFARDGGIDADAPTRLNGRPAPSLRIIAEETAAAITAHEPACLVHGDFCFSNLLYDARARRIVTLDPRAIDSLGAPTPWGDPRYDVAKLHHSVIGLYDHLVAGFFRLDRASPLDFQLTLPSDARLATVQGLFEQSRFAGRTPQQAQAPAISVHLFLSMLPLHGDRPDRQAAFLANAVRLFLDLARS